jgi:hypothetical protein
MFQDCYLIQSGRKIQKKTLKGPVSPRPVKVNCGLKCFVTLVTYCYNHFFVYFNLQLTLIGVGETGP